MTYTPGTITGTHRNPKGDPINGTVTVWAGVPAIRDTDDRIIYSGKVTAPLAGGTYALALAPSDDATFNPSGVTYTLMVELEGQAALVYRDVFVRAGETVDETQLLSPVDPSTPSYAVLVNEARVYAEQAAAAAEAAEAALDSIVNPKPHVSTLFGWSGAPIPGESPDFLATWMARHSWDPDMYNANYLGSNSDFQPWVGANPNKACVVGIPLIPHDSGQDLNALLDEVIAGSRDDVLRGMGVNLAYWTNSKVYARLFWEMNIRNGSSAPGDVMDRAKFIAAWRHAVPIIRDGYTNHAGGQYGFTKPFTQTLLIDFSPLSDGADFRAFYPGDDVVDVISMDVYPSIYGSTTPTPAQLLASVNGYLADVATFAEQHGKPVALGEWSTWQRLPDNGVTDSRGLGDFVPYIDAVFDWVEAHNPAYVSYYNISDNTGMTLADAPNSLARLQERLAAIRATPTPAPTPAAGSAPGVRLYKTGQSTATHSAVTDVALDAVDFNTGGDSFDLASNPGKVKVTKAGAYIVGGCVNVVLGDPGGRGVQIKVNGSIVRELPGNPLPNGGYDVRPGGVDFLQLAAGDVVSLSVYVEGGADATVNGSSNPKDTAMWIKAA